MPNPGDSAAHIKQERARIYSRSDLSDKEKAQEYAIYSSVLRRKKKSKGGGQAIWRGQRGYDRADQTQQEDRYAARGQVGRMLERHYRNVGGGKGRSKKGADSFVQDAPNNEHLTVVGLQRPMRREQMLAAAIWMRLRLLALKAAWDESKHPRDEAGRFSEIDREAYESEMRGPDSEAARTVSYAVNRAEEAAESINGAVESFWSRAATTVLEEDEDEDSGPWTALDELKHRLAGAGVRRVGPDELTDILRGGVFTGGGIIDPDTLRGIWDLMEEAVGGGSVDAARSLLVSAAEQADEDAQRDYEQAETIARGMALGELRGMAEQGVVQQANSDGRDFASFTSLPPVAIEYADSRHEGSPGVLVEFDGDAVRSSGAARIPEYHYIARDGQGQETFDSDMPFGIAGQREVRIRTGTPIADLRPVRITFMRPPSREDAELARRLVGRSGDVRALSASSAAWDESKHPRGQPGNPGQFAETEGGGGAAPPAAHWLGKDEQLRHRRELNARPRSDAARLWRRYLDGAQAITSEQRSLEKATLAYARARADFAEAAQRLGLKTKKKQMTDDEFAELDGRWLVQNAWREWVETATALRAEPGGVTDQLADKPFLARKYGTPDGQKIRISGSVINREKEFRDIASVGGRLRWNAINWRRAWNSLPRYLQKNVKVVALSAGLKHPNIPNILGQYSDRDGRITMNASDRFGEHSYARVRSLAVHEAQHARWRRGRTQEQRDDWKIICVELKPFDPYMKKWRDAALEAQEAAEDLARQDPDGDTNAELYDLETAADEAWELYANEIHSRIGEWHLEPKGAAESHKHATDEDALRQAQGYYYKYFGKDDFKDEEEDDRNA